MMFMIEKPSLGIEKPMTSTRRPIGMSKSASIAIPSLLKRRTWFDISCEKALHCDELHALA